MKRYALPAMAVALLIALIWWFSDEPLNDDARAWLADVPANSEAYRCLLGIGAAPDKDACTVGRQWLQRGQQQTDTAPPNHFGSLHNHALLCEYRNADCLLKQQADTSKARALLADNEVLRRRYRHLLSLEEFADLTPPKLESHFPHYTLLMAAARLQSLAVATRMEPADSLVREIRQLRHLLTRHHNLLSKMIVTAMLQEKLRLLALLVQQQRLANPLPAPLNAAEHNMDKSLKAEFRLMATFFLEQDYLDEGEDAYGRLALWVGLRPHVSVNRMTRLYRHYMDQATLPPSEREKAAFSLPAPRWRDRLRNPMGNLLLEIGAPDLSTYIARLDYLDAQLRLFHWLAEADKPPGNPWPSRAATPTRQDQRLCFDAPDSGGLSRPCLPLWNADPAPPL